VLSNHLSVRNANKCSIQEKFMWYEVRDFCTVLTLLKLTFRDIVFCGRVGGSSVKFRFEQSTLTEKVGGFPGTMSNPALLQTHALFSPRGHSCSSFTFQKQEYLKNTFQKN
jgi:hypothetical protein